MRLTYLFTSLALVSSIQALSIERDACSSIKCNDPTCDGTNNFLADKRGQCFTGACAGQPCLSVCPSAPISCNQDNCIAAYTGDATTLMCTSGDYAGCPCQNSCPVNMPKCSDSACAGSSNTQDPTGICGAPGLSDCPCVNSCPSSLPLCSDSSCGGANNPSGANSVCVSGPNRGCSCRSICAAPLLCSDSSCQGYNDPNNAGMSFCTAGPQAGCKCTSVCLSGSVLGAFGSNGCTQNGCHGLNNLNGTEFCTAGPLRGCHCTSQCPSTPPACSDTTKCKGHSGTCTGGDLIGCACTGADAVQKRSPTKALAARATETAATETDGPDAHIPYEYYVAQPRGQYDSTNAVTYPRDQIQRAINDAYLLNLENRVITAGNGRQYPQRFFIRGPNSADFNIPTDNPSIDASRLIEFPIIRAGDGSYLTFREGGNQGPDRVVLDALTGWFAGVFTHRGEVNNNFHRALANTYEVNDPALVDLGLTIIEDPPINWFAGMRGAGSGSLPYKRTPTYPPASFPTNINGCPGSVDGQCYCYNTLTVAGYFPRDAAIQAINQACSGWSGKQPTYNSDGTPVLATTQTVNQWSIEMDVRQILLVNAPSSTIDKNTCVRALTSAMDNCQTNTVTQKIGGEYQVWITGVGSQEYIIHPGTANPPPPAPPASDNVDFDE